VLAVRYDLGIPSRRGELPRLRVRAVLFPEDGIPAHRETAPRSRTRMAATKAAMTLPPIRSMDFYRETDGRLGVAYVNSNPGTVELSALHECLENQIGKGKAAEKEIDGYYATLGFVKPEDAPWPLPDRPGIPLAEWESGCEMGSLLAEIAAWFGTYVRLPTEGTARGIAAWVLESAVPEIASHAPSISFFGAPRSGKSRAIRALSLICRRPMFLAAPSPASLYALTDTLQPTILIDEWAHLAPDIARAVEAILRVGFDPQGCIPRRREHSDGVRLYKAFCFFGLASRRPIPDDVMDRTLPNHLTESTGVADLPLDNEDARDLRTAILRYRLEVLSGTSKRQPLTPADARSRFKLELPENVRISDRGLDKAEGLLAVANPFEAADDVREIIVLSETEGRTQYSFTPEAIIYSALVRLWNACVKIEGKPPTIPLVDVHGEIWRVLVDEWGYSQHTLENKDPFPPTELGPMIRTLGFKTTRGAAGMLIRDAEMDGKIAALSGKYGLKEAF
jgi:hypothetical protein